MTIVTRSSERVNSDYQINYQTVLLFKVYCTKGVYFNSWSITLSTSKFCNISGLGARTSTISGAEEVGEHSNRVANQWDTRARGVM